VERGGRNKQTEVHDALLDARREGREIAIGGIGFRTYQRV
jgi:hypothetical protein